MKVKVTGRHFTDEYGNVWRVKGTTNYIEIKDRYITFFANGRVYHLCIDWFNFEIED